jgi:hypothetical protein
MWYSGVATMLGMDASLEAKESDILWVPGRLNGWEVEGGSGYTGFDIGVSPNKHLDSRRKKIWGAKIYIIYRSANSGFTGKFRVFQAKTCLIVAL